MSNAQRSPPHTPVRGYANTINREHRLKRGATDTRAELDTDMQKVILGPAPIGRFFARLMPIDATLESQFKTEVETADFSSVYNPKSPPPLENKMYRPLAKEINTRGFSPKHEVYLSPNALEENESIKLRPDLGLQKKPTPKDTGPTTVTGRMKRKDGTYASARAETAAIDVSGGSEDVRPYGWSDAELCIEVKKSAADDGFDDNRSDVFLRISSAASQIRGQLATYVKEQMERQHRTHLFQVFIFGPYARFLYWDRSGAAVSRKFSYVEKPHLLAEFFWRYNHMTDAQRGWDTTVTLATEAEAKRLDRRVPDLLTAKLGDRPNLPDFEVTLSTSTYATHKTTVRFQDKREITLYIRRAFFQTVSPFGRATRGYIAYAPDLQDSALDKLYFMKDTWRTAYVGHAPEAQVYHDLARAHVPHLPTVLYASDVLTDDQYPQRTLIPSLLADKDESWAKLADNDIRPLAHARLIQLLAVPVICARNSREYTQVMCNALKTIIDANEKARILHRDVSLNNIMIDLETDSGILNDWDHSGPSPSDAERGEKPEERRQRAAFRTGTWQFMSIELLKDPYKIHNVDDDVQSLYWAFILGGLRHLRHNRRVESLDMFNEARQVHPKNSPVVWVGGQWKRAWISSAISLKELIFQCPGLQAVYFQIADKYHAAYCQAEPGLISEDSRQPSMPSPHDLLKVFQSALKAPFSWPPKDMGPNQFPPQTQTDTDRKMRQAIQNSRGSNSGNVASLSLEIYQNDIDSGSRGAPISDPDTRNSGSPAQGSGSLFDSHPPSLETDATSLPASEAEDDWSYFEDSLSRGGSEVPESEWEDNESDYKSECSLPNDGHNFDRSNRLLKLTSSSASRSNPLACREPSPDVTNFKERRPIVHLPPGRTGPPPSAAGSSRQARSYHLPTLSGSPAHPTPPLSSHEGPSGKRSRSPRATGEDEHHSGRPRKRHGGDLSDGSESAT